MLLTFEQIAEWSRSLRNRWQRRRTVRAARRFAVTLVLIGGPDLTGLSDDDLVEHLEGCMAEMGKCVRASGLSAAELQRALTPLGDAVRDLHKWLDEMGPR